MISMIIVLLGAPGAGKGEQGARVASKLKSMNRNYRMVIMGNILRTMSTTDSDLQEKLNSGALLDSNYINSVMDKYFKEAMDYQAGEVCIFDGYPRSVEQAEFLYNNLYAEIGGKFVIVNIEIDKSIVEGRILSRAVCKDCGNQFNAKSLDGMVCPKCSSTKLGRRGDDNVETIATRFIEYNNKTKPVIDYYKQLGDKVKIISIDGRGSMEEVSKAIWDELQQALR